jgi:hypothetical protein
MNNINIIKSGKLLGRFAQSHNNVIVEVTADYAIIAGRAYRLTWIEDHTFYYQYHDGGWWYYMRNGSMYEVIRYADGAHKLQPI